MMSRRGDSEVPGNIGVYQNVTPARRARRISREGAKEIAMLLERRLNPSRQRPEIRYPLQLILRQLDPKMMFEPRQQIKRLKTIDAERLKKIIVRREFFSGHLKMRRSQTQNLVESIVGSRHTTLASQVQIIKYKSQILTASTAATLHSLQISATLLPLPAAQITRRK